jgi:FAD/FMN-containing dehydrogenase/Fe-S oxidoreductase
MNAVRSPAPHLDRLADWKGLEQRLARVVRGEVRFDSGTRALYATDASNYRQAPIGVVLPRDAEDVIQTIAACREFGAPVLSRGGGTSLAGQCCNVAVVLDMSKYMNRVLEIDPQQRMARVQPGTILDDLRNAAERYHLTFGPDPATHDHCTLGGMIGNNSCGVHSVMSGKTVDNVEELDVLTYDGVRLRVGRTEDEQLRHRFSQPGRVGEIFRKLRSLIEANAEEVRARYPKIPRRVSGYNLDELLPENGFHVARALVGTEGTCVSVLEATVRLVPSPVHRALLVIGFEDVFTSADRVPEILPLRPIALEGIDEYLVSYMRKKHLNEDHLKALPSGRAWLLVEFGGDSREQARSKAEQLITRLHTVGAQDWRLHEEPRWQKVVWEIRESGLGATAFVPGEPYTWPGWEDSAVHPDRLGSYLRELTALFERYHYRAAVYGHFGDGCVHCRIPFDMMSAEGVQQYRRFMTEATELVLRFGGSLSGEHGDGQSRAEFLPRMYGQRLIGAFREFKSIWDPEWKMNPGKVVDPDATDSNLRLGASYAPPHPATHFSFPADQGQFAAATLRCVGVGKCRRMEAGTMCPSFMVTREEMHSTRGRAHLLFEMLQGDPVRHGWRDDHVREALDLCLSCKGCKGECPVNVDLATYKAEFLSHYYEGRLRPRSAYAFGFVDRWAQWASAAPEVVNFLTHAPGFAALAKLAAGMPQGRRIPEFAPQTFTTWFRRRRRARAKGQPILLWPDTFNNYFHPLTARSAAGVLERLGFQIHLPERNLCCGRPLYDFGFLEQAKQYLTRVMDALREPLMAGVPIVVLEPSCASVFRDELHELLPDHPLARRLQEQTFLLSEFLERNTPSADLGTLAGRALVHGHCHHKAVMRMDAYSAVLSRTGLDFKVLDSGCCGMAGSFGFEREKYGVSIAVGERVLLPAVRRAPLDTVIIADGFSCREQIAQCTDRHALHLADVLALAGNGAKGLPVPAESRWLQTSRREHRKAQLQTGALAAAAGLLWLATRRGK